MLNKVIHLLSKHKSLSLVETWNPRRRQWVMADVTDREPQTYLTSQMSPSVWHHLFVCYQTVYKRCSNSEQNTNGQQSNKEFDVAVQHQNKEHLTCFTPSLSSSFRTVMTRWKMKRWRCSRAAKAPAQSHERIIPTPPLSRLPPADLAGPQRCAGPSAWEPPWAARRPPRAAGGQRARCQSTTRTTTSTSPLRDKTCRWDRCNGKDPVIKHLFTASRYLTRKNMEQFHKTWSRFFSICCVYKGFSNLAWFSFVCVFVVCQVEEEEGQLVLDRNPLEWTVDEVVQFINSTDCASLANIFQEQVCVHEKFGSMYVER